MRRLVQRANVAAAVLRVGRVAASLSCTRRANTTWWPSDTPTATTDVQQQQQQQQCPPQQQSAGAVQGDERTATVASSTPSCLGVVHITSQNISSELATRVPVLLYFMLTTHADVNAYTLLLCRHVDQLNRRLQAAGLAEAYDEHGKDAGLAIKLGIVDCVVAPALVQHFAVHPDAFPVIYFMYKGQAVDRLVGIVAETQVTDAMDAFVTHAKEQTSEERAASNSSSSNSNNSNNSSKSNNSDSGGARAQTTSAGASTLPHRHDSDDENAVTLLTAAHEHLKKKQLAKAKELFAKALDYATREMDVVKQRHGVAYKKLTRELSAKLRGESCYYTVPSALCGLAMTALAGKERDEARRFVDRVRDEYPYAVHELRDVATAVARVEIIFVADFDPETDTYVTLMRRAAPDEDAVAFYRKHLKLAAAFFFEGTKRNALEECLRLIRAEPKLLTALKDGGVVPRDLVLGARARTPARALLQFMLDALGPIDEDAVLARRLLQQYT